MKTKSTIIFLIFAIWLIQGCAPSTNLQTVTAKDPLPENCRPLIYRPNDEPPENYEVVATVRHGDAGMSIGCGKEAIREMMSTEACKAGANGILIKKESSPSLVSTCYRVTAEYISY
jgi:hypothetical protein